jgi:hypothetical protein
MKQPLFYQLHSSPIQSAINAKRLKTICVVVMVVTPVDARQSQLGQSKRQLLQRIVVQSPTVDVEPAQVACARDQANELRRGQRGNVLEIDFTPLKHISHFPQANPHTRTHAEDFFRYVVQDMIGYDVL